MSFLDGKPRAATEEDTKARWCGGKPGENFRCGFCGHQFAVGEQWRCCYVNDMGSPTWGNPLVCEKCDGPNDEVRARWKARCEEFYLDPKWWWFRRGNDE